MRQATKNQDFPALTASQFRGPNPENALREFIEAAGLFLVDGADEIADTRPDVLADLADVARRNPRCGFVIASRPNAALPCMTADGAGHSLFSDWPVLHFLPWKSEQVQDYVKMRLGDELEPDALIRDILQTPVFLAAYCELREVDPTSAPKTVSGILSVLLEKLLQRAVQRGNLKKITVPFAKVFLAEEAFEMKRERIYAKPRGEWFAEVLQDCFSPFFFCESPMISFQQLKFGRKNPSEDLGPDHFNRMDAKRLTRYYSKKLERLGFNVTITPVKETHDPTRIFS